jgi:hypothetical protein
MFSSYEKNHDPQRAITFGDGNQGLVKGLGKIAISPDHSISNVFLVDSLDYNLLSVSQLCKMGYNYRCTFVLCLIGRPKAHNFWHDPDLAWSNLIVGLGCHDPICGPCLGLKSSTRASLTQPI